jgi:HEAT repeat protein
MGVCSGLIGKSMTTPSKRPDPVEQELSAIHALRASPRTPESLARLRKALGDKSSFVVAAAATLIAEAELSELLPQLPPAFHRFLITPAKIDKGCKAKIALADALYRLESQDAALFRIGLRHVQPEPVWGGQQDTAAELRGLCALALSQLGAVGVVEELADLLADRETTARVLCARALGCCGREEALPLLRYKVRIGDAAGEVLLECFVALLSLAPERVMPLIAEVLERGDASRREAAALALGQSRRDEALPLLEDLASRLPMHERRVALVAIATLRSAPAVQYLIELLGSAPLSLAEQAVRALGIFRFDEAVCQRVRDALRERDEAPLLRAAEESFDGSYNFRL